jgi:Mn-dependent DtxR family transcriptional regulator
MENVVQKRSVRNSIERIDEYLKNKGDYVVINQIAKDLNLQFSSIKKCVETLDKLGRVEFVTNGKVTLVRFRTKTGDSNGANTIQ